jgi:hypothetical protein
MMTTITATIPTTEMTYEAFRNLRAFFGDLWSLLTAIIASMKATMPKTQPQQMVTKHDKTTAQIDDSVVCCCGFG